MKKDFSSNGRTRIVIAIICIAFLAAVLTACATPLIVPAESLTEMPAVTSTTTFTESPSLTPTPSSEPSLRDGPPDEWLLLKTVECDFDGDGTRETVELKNNAAQAYTTVIAEASGGSIDFREVMDWYPNFMNIDNATMSVDLDGDGGEELLIVTNIGANGGWGGKGLAVLTLDGDSVRILYAGTLCGFSAAGKLLPNFKAEIAVKETDATLTFPFSDAYHLEYEGYYGKDGELLKDAVVNVDAICYVATDDESGIVEIGQYIWADMHSGGAEFLVTELTFDKNGYTVIKQRVEPYEYAQKYVGSG